MKPALALAGADEVADTTSVTVTKDDTFAVVRVGEKAVIRCADGEIVVSSRLAGSKLAAAAVSALALLVTP